MPAARPAHTRCSSGAPWCCLGTCAQRGGAAAANRVSRRRGTGAAVALFASRPLLAEAKQADKRAPAVRHAAGGAPGVSPRPESACLRKKGAHQRQKLLQRCETPPWWTTRKEDASSLCCFSRPRKRTADSRCVTRRALAACGGARASEAAATGGPRCWDCTELPPQLPKQAVARQHAYVRRRSAARGQRQLTHPWKGAAGVPSCTSRCLRQRLRQKSHDTVPDHELHPGIVPARARHAQTRVGRSRTAGRGRRRAGDRKAALFARCCRRVSPRRAAAAPPPPPAQRARPAAKAWPSRRPGRAAPSVPPRTPARRQ